MKQIGILLALAICLTSAHGEPSAPNAPSQCHVYFSPRGGCTEAVVDALGRARSSVLVQTYSFTSARIAKALPLLLQSEAPVAGGRVDDE